MVPTAFQCCFQGNGDVIWGSRCALSSLSSPSPYSFSSFMSHGVRVSLGHGRASAAAIIPRVRGQGISKTSGTSNGMSGWDGGHGKLTKYNRFYKTGGRRNAEISRYAGYHGRFSKVCFCFVFSPPNTFTSSEHSQQGEDDSGWNNSSHERAEWQWAKQDQRSIQWSQNHFQGPNCKELYTI